MNRHIFLAKGKQNWTKFALKFKKIVGKANQGIKPPKKILLHGTE